MNRRKLDQLEADADRLRAETEGTLNALYESMTCDELAMLAGPDVQKLTDDELDAIIDQPQTLADLQAEIRRMREFRAEYARQLAAGVSNYA